MTAALPGRPSGSWSAASPRSTDSDVGLIRPVIAAAAIAGLVALFVAQAGIRHLEAELSGHLAALVGLQDPRVLGSSVLFDVDGTTTGYGITLGCTVAFLVLPFTAATTGLLAVRRVPVGRSLLALLAAVVVVLLFNQLRLLAIAGGMQLWGPEVGYARTHVLVGTIISTVGVVLAGTSYLVVLLRGTFPPEHGAAGGGRDG